MSVQTAPELFNLTFKTFLEITNVKKVKIKQSVCRNYKDRSSQYYELKYGGSTRLD